MIGNPQLALFILRIVVGAIFILHGSQKVFGFFGGSGLQGWAQWLGSIGVPTWMAYIAAFAELLGGCMLAFSIAPQIGAISEICMMIGAIYLVHAPHGFFIQNNGFEYSFVLMLCCLVILIGGVDMWTLWDPFKNLF